MNIPNKKLKNGFSIPAYGIGTWQMGGRMEPDPNNDDEADIAAIKAAIDKGITHIDTAEIYADGKAEKMVGEAIKDCDRKKLFITSKLWPTHFRYDDVLLSCEKSLKRIGIDYLDLYLLHMFNKDVPLRDTIKAMDKLVEEKMVKYIGVSNFEVATMKQAIDLSGNPIVCNQVHYNLLYREPEIRDHLLKYCQENDIILSAWRPLQKGLILDDVAPVLKEMADKYKKTLAQIAINWLISQDHVITLSKTTNLDHLEENLGAIGWTMEQSDIEKLRKEFSGQKEQSDIWPLTSGRTTTW